MASTYVNDLRLNEMATGDASGSWGTVTNTNLELIGEAFSYGTETIGDADSTLTIADGAADAARSFYLKITSSVDLTTTRIVTLGPNTVSKVWMIENATTGSQVITIKQGSGATINVPNGQVKMISTDGAGSGGAVLDLLVDVDLTGTTTLVNLNVSGAVDIAGDLTLSAGGDGALRFTAASSVKVLDNNAAALVFEEADNAYMTFVTTDGSEAVKFDKALDINAATQIDATVTVGVDDTGYDVKFFGATAGAYMLWDESADDLILGGAAGLSVNSAATVGGTLGVTGVVTANAGVVVDTMTLDAATLTATGDFTVDAAGDIILDADGQQIILKDGGTTFAEVYQASNNLFIEAKISDGDILFRGNDGGSIITALTLDMSAAGNATFNSNVLLPDDRAFVMGASSDFQIYHESSVNIIQAATSNQDIVFKGNDGGSTITALTLDMSEGGYATFNNGMTLKNDIYINNADGSLTVGYLYNDSNDFIVRSYSQDKDIIFKGNDGGSLITALTLDMSAGGNATFNAGVSANNFFASDNMEIRADDAELYFTNAANNRYARFLRDNSNNGLDLNFFDGSSTVTRFKFGQTGNLQLNHGNLVIGTAGKGIDFSAQTGTATGTTTAELLDHYEEGTWTPSVGGDATYTTQSGTYTKVGRQVVAHFSLVINTIGTGSTYAIAGLPFTSAYSGQVYVGYFGSLATAATFASGYINATYSSINLVYATAATTTVVNAGNAIGSSTNISGVAVYFT
jgi:hypothetical protein